MIIYVAGYPKSGTTWITRLLGDVLACRSGGSIPSEDKNEIATEYFGTNSEYFVRKGHFILNDRYSSNPVRKPHVMHWKGLDPELHKVVFVVRDPRDIAVSGAHHWKIPVYRFLENMISGTNGVRLFGPWHVYIDSWLSKRENVQFVSVRYEDMLEGSHALASLLLELGYDEHLQKVRNAYERQSFENRLRDIREVGDTYPLGKAFNLRFMRKGKAGDWRNHFTRSDAFNAETCFGDLLRRLGYESDAFWWKEIS